MKKLLAWPFLLISEILIFLYALSFRAACYFDWRVAIRILGDKDLADLYKQLDKKGQLIIQGEGDHEYHK